MKGPRDCRSHISGVKLGSVIERLTRGAAWAKHGSGVAAFGTLARIGPPGTLKRTASHGWHAGPLGPPRRRELDVDDPDGAGPANP